jgi:TusA-related sulfurtransferase
MKKLLLLSVILLQVSFLFAQGSLQMMTADGEQIENGQTIEVIVTDLDAFETVSEEYFVRNNSANDLDVGMRMIAVELVEGADYSFCALGSCFPPGMNETPGNFSIPANTTVGDGGVFTGHYHPHGFAGTSVIRYTFYNAADENDTIAFNISFNGNPMETNSLQMLNSTGEQIENGQTIEVIVDDLNAFETVSEEYFVRNNSNNDLTIGMRMTAVELVEGAEYSFCALGSCFPAGINETAGDFVITANTTVGDNGVFTGHYHPHGFAGTSLIRYTLYNANNENDTTSFMISFVGEEAAYETSLQMLDAAGEQIANGQTIAVDVPNLDEFETVSEEYFVRNNSNNDLNIRMRMEAVSLVDGAQYSFCALGSCFPAGINETTRDFPITANTTVGNDGVFTGHYHPNSNSGTSVIRYTFYNVADLNDTVSFMISFSGDDTGIGSIDENAAINAYPNPTNNTLFIQYDLKKIKNGYLNLYNTLGALVLQQEINSPSGLINLNVSELPKGIYMYQFESASVKSRANKVLVN